MAIEGKLTKWKEQQRSACRTYHQHTQYAGTKHCTSGLPTRGQSSHEKSKISTAPEGRSHRESHKVIKSVIKCVMSEEFFRGSRTLSRREVKRESKVEIRTAMKNEIQV